MRLLAVALLGAAACAQDGTVQPTATRFGLVGVGAVAEASFGVFWSEPSLFDKVATVKAPAGVKVIAVETSKYGDRALTQVQLALDTTRAAAVDAVCVVSCEGKEVRVELTADIVALPRGGARVLVADSPFEAFSTEDPALFDGWRHLVVSARLDVDYRLARKGRPTFDAEALRRVAVVVVGCDAIWQLDAEQIAMLRGFVCGGGRVVLFANSFYAGTVAKANAVAAPFGVQLVDSELTDADAYSADAGGIHKHPLTVGVESVQASRPSPALVVDPTRGTALVDLIVPREQPLVALGTSESGGEVVVIGVSLWWQWVGQHDGNERFLRNLLVRAPRMR